MSAPSSVRAALRTGALALIALAGGVSTAAAQYVTPNLNVPNVARKANRGCEAPTSMRPMHANRCSPTTRR